MAKDPHERVSMKESLETLLSAENIREVFFSWCFERLKSLSQEFVTINLSSCGYEILIYTTTCLLQETAGRENY